MSGSMAAVPKDLLEEIQKLEVMFTIPTAKLKEITERFVSELEKGVLPPLSIYAICAGG